MAGRGRDAVIPAWMKAGGAPAPTGTVPGVSSAPAPHSAPRAPPADEHGGRRRSKSRSRSRSPDRRRRAKSPRRSGSRSRTPPRRTRPKKKSNFDVGPAGEFTPAAPILAPALGSDARFTATVPPAALGYSTDPGASVSLQATRHARRIYVGGIGQVEEREISEFFNDVVTRALGKPCPGGSYVISVYINHERRFAFVEFGSIELTSACMQLDGIQFRGQPLKVRRPNDYNASMVPPSSEPVPVLNMAALGVVSTSVPDGQNKVFVGGLAYELTQESVMELLSAFGPLKSFHLVKDPGATLSKGYGFCEWADPSVTDRAIEALNNMPVCGKTLTVRRAVGAADAKAGLVGVGGAAGLGAYGAAFEGVPAVPALAHTISAGAPLGTPVPVGAPATRVLVLANMVTPEELRDDEEFEDIVADVRDECAKFGAVKSVVIPRSGAGLGKVFVEFGGLEQCVAAKTTLGGRMFASRKVVADFMPEADFAARNFADFA